MSTQKVFGSIIRGNHLSAGALPLNVVRSTVSFRSSSLDGFQLSHRSHSRRTLNSRPHKTPCQCAASMSVLHRPCALLERSCLVLTVFVRNGVVGSRFTATGIAQLQSSRLRPLEFQRSISATLQLCDFDFPSGLLTVSHDPENRTSDADSCRLGALMPAHSTSLKM